MNINLIGVPIFFGCDKKGVDLAPDKLREKNIVQIIKNNNHTVYDLGNLHIPNKNQCDKFSYHENMKYVDSIIDMNTNLAHAVYSSLNSKSFPLIIGGDHSLGLGSISGASKYYNNLAVIWIDAHGDINTHETSPSGNVHGMPLAAAMGIGHHSLTELYFKGQKVNPKNVFIIGARDLDSGELQLIEDYKLNVYTTEEVQKRGVENILNEINRILVNNKIDAVHLSFDIDSVDPEFLPGTGTPVENGLTVSEAKFILKYLLETKLIKSMDFVELNTELDKSNNTIEVCVEIIDYISKYL
ncbi:MAG: arginase [Clostridium argentinense]|uniref:Arginase n=1 Tax=Clostridium faecium TaxID=2762223 RepID=A0ABR8YQX2_9CLOT|nr:MULTISPECIES: arginase [Clostridium]MBD8046624.1 arginase [Clostridium faecium]MBS5825488.1 arginase [Clostridium argentinense]MDU1348705.1 arginase [Clostridium argentinense]